MVGSGRCGKPPRCGPRTFRLFPFLLDRELLVDGENSIFVVEQEKTTVHPPVARS